MPPCRAAAHAAAAAAAELAAGRAAAAAAEAAEAIGAQRLRLLEAQNRIAELELQVDAKSAEIECSASAAKSETADLQEQVEKHSPFRSFCRFRTLEPAGIPRIPSLAAGRRLTAACL